MGDRNKIRVGELFAGIGGIGLGLEWTGEFEVVWQVEKDDYATKVLEKHWPDVPKHDDVCTFPPETGNWDCDLICGGFPCQDISFAGKGAGLEGERSGLFYEGIRIIDRLRPRWVLLENVTALLIRGLDDVLGELAEIGYDAEWHCIPASSVGASHRRDRVFIIAHTQYHGAPEDWHDGRSRRDGGKRDVANSTGIRPSGQGALRKPVYTTEKAYRETVKSIPSSLAKNWEIEPDVGRVVDGVSPELHRSDRLRCLGNAVVPQVAQFIGAIILQRIGENDGTYAKSKRGSRRTRTGEGTCPLLE